MKSLFKILFIMLLVVITWNMFSPPTLIYHGDMLFAESTLAASIISALVAFALAIAIVMVAGLVAAISMFAVIVVLAGLFVGFAFSWPMILLLIVLYWIFSDRKQHRTEINR